MAVDAGTINAEVRLLLADLKRDVLNVQSNLNQITKKSQEVSKKSTAAFGPLKKVIAGLGATIIFRKIVQGFNAVVRAASDAEETTSKLNTVFSRLEKETKNATNELVTGFGLSSQAAKTLLGDTGDLLTGFGFTQEMALDLSTSVQKLAVDLASFTNFSGGAEGASKALTKALLGERETVKSLGIAILEVDVKAKIAALEATGRLTNETERQKKAIATLQIAYEQSKNAVGDFARTSNQLANQARILQGRFQDLLISIGVKFLPVVNDIVTAISDLIKQDEELLTSTKNLTTAFDAWQKAIALTETEMEGLTAQEKALNEIRKLEAQQKFLDTIENISDGYDKQQRKLKKLTVSNKAHTVAVAANAKELKRGEKDHFALLKIRTAVGIGTAKAGFAEGQYREALKLAGQVARASLQVDIDLNKTRADAELALNNLALAQIQNNGIDLLSLVGNEKLKKAIIERIAAIKAGTVVVDKDTDAKKKGAETTKELTDDQIKLLAELTARTEEFDKTDAQLALLKIQREREKALAVVTGNKEATDAVNAFFDNLEKREEELQKKDLFKEHFNKAVRAVEESADIIFDLLSASFDEQLTLTNSFQDELDAMDEEATNAKRDRRKAALKSALLDSDNEFKDLQQKELDKIILEEKAEERAKEIKELERREREKQFKREQKASIAQAVINGALGASKSIAQWGMPWGAVYAGLAIAAAGAQIAAIRKESPAFQFGGVVPGNRGDGIDSQTIQATPGEMVLNDAQQSQLFDQINNGAGGTLTINIITENGDMLNQIIQDRTTNGEMNVHVNGLIGATL